MIEEVRRRINVTKEEKLGYLDLRGLELTTIPQEILEVPWIGVLSLSNNKIKDISILPKMKNLHKLALTNNEIEDISMLEHMPKLRFIFLAQNKVKDISAIKTQTRLKKLVLFENEISHLPDLSYVPLLAYLDISENPIALPPLEKLKEMLPSMKIFKH